MNYQHTCHNRFVHIWGKFTSIYFCHTTHRYFMCLCMLEFFGTYQNKKMKGVICFTIEWIPLLPGFKRKCTSEAFQSHFTWMAGSSLSSLLTGFDSLLRHPWLAGKVLLCQSRRPNFQAFPEMFSMWPHMMSGHSRPRQRLEMPRFSPRRHIVIRALFKRRQQSLVAQSSWCGSLLLPRKMNRSIMRPQLDGHPTTSVVSGRSHWKLPRTGEFKEMFLTAP